MIAPAETAEKRVMGSAFKKMNDGILQFLKGIRIRSLGAALLGSCAGLSLTASVLPSVFDTLGHSDSFSIRWALAGYASYAMLTWGVGGWAARRVGNTAAGSAVMGLLGLVSGLLLTYAEIDQSLPMLLAGGGVAMVYGGIGGLLITTTLSGEKQVPPSVKGASTVEKSKNPPRGVSHKDDSVRFFRFFK